MSSIKILVINGPNINMLGIREPGMYGEQTYQNLTDFIKSSAEELNVLVECFQSNHEGDIVDKIQSAYKKFDGIVINPAAYTHTSVAILDALKSVSIPTVEVHISDISKREDFRKTSYIQNACICSYIGFGFNGYKMALERLKNEL